MRRFFLSVLCVILLLVPVSSWGGVDFDGLDDRIQLTDGNTCDFEASTEDFSFSAWVKSNDTTSFKAIIYKADANDDFWRVIQNNNGTIRASIDTIDESSTETITSGQWTSIIATFDRDGDMVVYVDGVASSGTALLSETMNLVVQTITIGELDIDGSQNWDGEITEVAVYTKILSSQEIENLSKSKVKGMPLQIGSLCFYLPMDDEPDGTSANNDTFSDKSLNGFDGTGDDGSNNTGLTAKAEEVLTYP